MFTQHFRDNIILIFSRPSTKSHFTEQCMYAFRRIGYCLKLTECLTLAQSDHIRCLQIYYSVTPIATLFMRNTIDIVTVLIKLIVSFATFKLRRKSNLRHYSPTPSKSIILVNGLLILYFMSRAVDGCT